MLPALLTAYLWIPLALLVAATAVRWLSLWSPVGSITIPWLCSAVAIAQLLLGILVFSTRHPLAEISWYWSVAYAAVLMGIYVVGLIVDAKYYCNGKVADGLWGALGLAAIFAVLLVVGYKVLS